MPPLVDLGILALLALLGAAAFAIWAFRHAGRAEAMPEEGTPPGRPDGGGDGGSARGGVAGSATGSDTGPRDAGAGPGRESSPIRELANAGWVELRLGEGRSARIRLLLPGPGTDGGAAPGGRTQVLILHPDPVVVARRSLLLASRGHEVVAASSVVEARLQAAVVPRRIDLFLDGSEAGFGAMQVPFGAPGAFGAWNVATPLSAEALADVVDRAARPVAARRHPPVA